VYYKYNYCLRNLVTLRRLAARSRFLVLTDYLDSNWNTLMTDAVGTSAVCVFKLLTKVYINLTFNWLHNVTNFSHISLKNVVRIA
jgi:hypothetical protein